MPLFCQFLVQILDGQVDTIFSNEKVILTEEMLIENPMTLYDFFWNYKSLFKWNY